MPEVEGQGQRVPLGRTYLLLLLTTILWGGGPVAGKLALQGIPILTLGFLRFGLASLILLGMFWREIPAVRGMRRHDLWLLGALGLFGAFLSHLLFFLGLRLAPASHGSIISPTTSPIWTLLLAARMGGEHVTRAQVAGMSVCTVGVLLVIRPDRLALAGTGPLLLGDLFFLLGGMAWGLYSFLAKVAMRRLSPQAALACSMTVGALLLLPLAALERPRGFLGAAPAASWAGLLYLTVGNTVLAFFWWNLGIQHVGAGRTAVFSNLIPVFGVVLAWLILGEQLSAIQLMGGGFALAGVWVCQASPSPRGLS